MYYPGPVCMSACAKNQDYIYKGICALLPNNSSILFQSISSCPPHLADHSKPLGLVTFLQLDFSFKQITYLLLYPTCVFAAFFIFAFCLHQVCPPICFHQMCSRSLMEDGIDVLIRFLHTHQSPPQASSLPQIYLTYCHHIGNSTGEDPQNKWISHQDQLLCR